MNRTVWLLVGYLLLLPLAGGCSKKPPAPPETPELKAKVGARPKSGPLPIE